MAKNKRKKVVKPVPSRLSQYENARRLDPAPVDVGDFFANVELREEVLYQVIELRPPFVMARRVILMPPKGEQEEFRILTTGLPVLFRVADVVRDRRVISGYRSTPNPATHLPHSNWMSPNREAKVEEHLNRLDDEGVRGHYTGLVPKSCKQLAASGYWAFS